MPAPNFNMYRKSSNWFKLAVAAQKLVEASTSIAITSQQMKEALETQQKNKNP